MSGNVKCTLCIEIKTMQMYKKCIAEHASLKDSQLCAVPRFTVHTEVKVGLCWKKSQVCFKSVDTQKKCSSWSHTIHSDMHKMHAGNARKIPSLMSRVIETT